MNPNKLSRTKVTALQVLALISAAIAAIVPQIEDIDNDADPFVVAVGLVGTLLAVWVNRTQTTPSADPRTDDGTPLTPVG